MPNGDTFEERGQALASSSDRCPPPLAGLRVLELGHFVAAPFATRLLADLGADVIKVEPPGGDPVRGWGEQIDGHSLWWSVHGRGKRSVVLDLKTQQGLEAVRRLASTCDAVIENFRPGQLERLGLGDAELRRCNPDIIIGHISGYGQDGPYRDRAAFGVIGEAVGGLRYLTNHEPGRYDLPPVRVGVSIGDSIAGLYAALGVVAALWRRGKDPARTIDVALSEAVLSMTEGMVPEFGKLGKVRQPSGAGIPTAAPSSAYPTSDGWILIAANSQPLFALLADLIGRPELLSDERFTDNNARCRNRVPLDEAIAGWTVQQTADDCATRLDEAGIPNSHVFTARECVNDEQFRHRKMVRDVQDPLLGTMMHPGIVPRMTGDAGTIRWTGPAVGADTEAILAEIGMTATDISPEAG